MLKLVKTNFILQLSILYFITVFTYSFFGSDQHSSLKSTIGCSRVPLLILLYYISSKKKNTIYIFALTMFLFASFLFQEKTAINSLLGSLASLVYRFLIFILVYKSVKSKNWVAITLASIPFICIYISFILLIENELKTDIYPWIINGLLTSLIGGIAVYNYIFEEGNKNFWLLISAILFIFQIGVFFIQNYYFTDEILRKLTIILFGISNYTFYKFMILAEERENGVLSK